MSGDLRQFFLSCFKQYAKSKASTAYLLMDAAECDAAADKLEKDGRLVMAQRARIRAQAAREAAANGVTEESKRMKRFTLVSHIR